MGAIPAAEYEVRRGDCDGTPTASFTGESSPAIEAGSYGLHVVVYDVPNCRVLGSACQMVSLPTESDIVVDVPVLPESTCNVGQSCQSGSCVAAGETRITVINALGAPETVELREEIMVQIGGCDGGGDEVAYPLSGEDMSRVGVGTHGVRVRIHDAHCRLVGDVCEDHPFPSESIEITVEDPVVPAVGCGPGESCNPDGECTSFSPYRVGAGQAFACAWREETVTGGGVYCWGESSEGGLGNRSAFDRWSTCREGVAAGCVSCDMDDSISCRENACVAGGGDCPVENCTTNADLVCLPHYRQPTALQVNLVDRPGQADAPLLVKTAAVGSRSACAISMDNELFCWGLSLARVPGQMGESRRAFVPAIVDPVRYTEDPENTILNNVACGHDSCYVALELNGRHTVRRVIPANEGLAAFGDPCTQPADCWSQLCGSGGTCLPIERSTYTNFVEGPYRTFAMNDSTLCASDESGRTQCLSSRNFTLGGPVQPSADERLVGPVLTERTLSLGIGVDHVCGISTDGDLVCWGNSCYGQIGVDMPGSGEPPCSLVLHAPMVVDVPLLSQVSAAHYVTCVTDYWTGELRCFGGFRGELGTKDSPQRFAMPVAEQITRGNGFSCASTGSMVYCGGRNDTGQLGRPLQDGEVGPQPAAPVRGL